MKNGTENKDEKACIYCNKHVGLIFNQEFPYIKLTQEEYQKRIAEKAGMYCPNCNHMICIACLPIIKSQKKSSLLSILSRHSNSEHVINMEDIPKNLMTDEIRTKIEDILQKKGQRVTILKCAKCGAVLGEARKELQKQLQDIADKFVDDTDSITLSEVRGVINDLQEFITRLKRYNLIAGRVEKLKTMLTTTIEKVAFPIFKHTAAAFTKQGKYNEAKDLCVEARNWVKIIRDRSTFESTIKQIELLIEMQQSTAGQKLVIEARPTTFYVKVDKS